VEDETGGLRRPGFVSFIAPQVGPRKQASVAAVAGERITTGGPLEAARFTSGETVVIRKDKKAEVALVLQVRSADLVLAGPAGDDYTGGVLEQAALPRFGVSRDWLRVRWDADVLPDFPRIRGIYLNAAASQQMETITDETLGSGEGSLNQTVFFRKFPVMPGEKLEVRELEGARADVEYPILREELLAQGFPEDDIRAVTEARSGKVQEVWVRWRAKPHLFFSGPDDRHYAIERSRGRVLFGDGLRGRVPAAGRNNIRAARYCSGGGLRGNVPARTMTQMLSGVPAQSVFNPVPASGGADTETLQQVLWRGPEVMRHRARALSARDYEALARESSPGVAAARALPATSAGLRPAPGSVTLIVVPHSADAAPMPPYEMRRFIARYLAARAPASVDPNRITVIGPKYVFVGVSARVEPADRSEAASVRQAVLAALARFLHPLQGGPEGRGWPFARGVFLSDVAGIVEGVRGVDYVRRLQLTVDGIPAGDRVDVAPERMVAAGPLDIEVGAE
jgi:predicted phage baseplate assembly protein